MNKVKPGAEDESYYNHRNDHLVKNAHRQMDYDRRASGEAPPKKLKAPDKDSESATKEEPPWSSKVDAVVFVIVLAQVVRTSFYVKINKYIDAFMTKSNFLLCFFNQLVGYVAIGLTIYVYTLDQQWNKVLNGELEIMELDGHNVFKGKTYELTGHNYLIKARDYATRQEPLEIIFIIILIILCIISTVHVLMYYLFAENVEQYSALVINF